MMKTQYVDGALLDEYFDKSGLRIGFVIDKLGITKSAYYLKKNGKRSFTASEVYVICDLLRIPDEDKDKIFCFEG